MNKIKILIFLSTCGLLLGGFTAEAHQPNFVNKAKEFSILNPEISQAFCGFLDGEPVRYSINSEVPFELYVGLLTPDVSNPQNNLFADIKNSAGEELIKLDGLNNFKWGRWYEEYGGDWYWQGPEFRQEVPAGEYTVTVYNWINKGEYVLVVGQLESFPASQLPKMFGELYKIKTQFFQKPWYSVFQNKIGFYFAALLIITMFLVEIGIRLVKKIRNKTGAQ